MTGIEAALYQTQNECRQNPLNYAIRLNNELTSLMGTVSVGDAAPNDGAREVRDELEAMIKAQLQALQAVWEERIPSLNRLIIGTGLVRIEVPEIEEAAKSSRGFQRREYC